MVDERMSVCAAVRAWPRGGCSDWRAVLHGGWFTVLGGVRLQRLLNRGWSPPGVTFMSVLANTNTSTRFCFVCFFYIYRSLSFSVYLTVALQGSHVKTTHLTTSMLQRLSGHSQSSQNKLKMYPKRVKSQWQSARLWSCLLRVRAKSSLEFLQRK